MKSSRISCAALCKFALYSLVALVFAVLLAWKRWFPLSRQYDPISRPPWRAARWRGERFQQETFSQWWYLFCTDSENNITYSLGFGGFRGDDAAGGWLKVKDGRAGAPPPRPPVRLTLPFSSLRLAPGSSTGSSTGIDVDIGADSSPHSIHMRALDDSRMHITMQLEGGAAADVIVHREYGVFGQPVTAAAEAAEACVVANLPFAYASRITGTFTMGGHTVHFTDDSGRYRAYLESTWGCSFPSGGDPHNDADAATEHEYPWRWMWAVLPADAPRVGVAGEVGLVMSNARMRIPLIPPLPSLPAVGAALRKLRLALTVQGTFAFLDLPDRRIAAVNVTLFDGNPTWAVPLVLAAPPEPALCAADCSSRELEMAPLQAVWLELDNWQPFTDAHGTTHLPMQQVLRVVTARYDVTATYDSQPGDFVRLAVRYRDEHAGGIQRVVSDFRASCSTARLRVLERHATGSSVFLDAVMPHNAVEFAFHAPFAEAPEEQQPQQEEEDVQVHGTHVTADEAVADAHADSDSSAELAEAAVPAVPVQA